MSDFKVGDKVKDTNTDYAIGTVVDVWDDGRDYSVRVAYYENGQDIYEEYTENGRYYRFRDEIVLVKVEDCQDDLQINEAIDLYGLIKDTDICIEISKRTSGWSICSDRFKTAEVGLTKEELDKYLTALLTLHGKI